MITQDILFEYDESGAIGNRYIHGPGEVMNPIYKTHPDLKPTEMK